LQVFVSALLQPEIVHGLTVKMDTHCAFRFCFTGAFLSGPK
jgi:hypothetical protein